MKDSGMKELVERIALPCRDDGVRFTDESRLNAIAGAGGQEEGGGG